MQWKVIREAGSDLTTLRVGDPSGADLQELTLPSSDWLRVAQSIIDMDRPEPPSSWSARGDEDR